MQAEQIDEGSEIEYVEGSEEYDEDYDEEYTETEEEIDEGEIEGIEDDDEDEEGDAMQPGTEYIRGLHPLPGDTKPSSSRRSAPAEPPKEWQGLHQLPAATRTTFSTLLGKLRDQRKQHLTILLLGKGNMGKSSTANSLFGERVVNVAAFQADTVKPVTVSRIAAGFTLTVIDTPGLLEGDSVSESHLAAIAFEIRNTPVDVVLYVDRLDGYRVEAADRQVMAAITCTFGSDIWANTVIGLTHGKMVPINMEYAEYAERRAEGLQAAIRKEGAGKAAALPVMLIENSSRASTNAGGEKTLPNDVAWLPALMEEVVKVALETQPYHYDPAVASRSNPNRRKKWLIPLVLAAQIAFKVFVLDRIMEEDGVTGDQYGPYDEDFIEEERERRQMEKEEQKRRKDAEAARQARKKAAAQAQAAAAAATAQSGVDVEEDPDEEYSDSDDDEEE